MTRSNIKRLSLVAASLAALSVPIVATASPHAGVDVQLYKPAFDGNGLFSLESAEAMKKNDFAFRLEVNFGQQPFRLPVPGIGQDDAVDVGEDSVLKFAVTLHFTLGFALTEKLSMGLDAGVYRTATDEGYGKRGLYNDDPTRGRPSTGLISLRPLTNVDPSGGFEDAGLSGPIDPRFGLKYTLFGGPSKKINLAAMLTVSVPFGDEEMFLGDSSFVFEPRLMADFKPSRGTKVVANVGARLRKRTVLEAYYYDPMNTGNADLATPETPRAVFDLGSELTAGIGAQFEVLPRLLVAVEGSFFVPLPKGLSYGSCELSSGEDCDALDDPLMSAGGAMLQDNRYFEDQSYGDPAGLALAGLSYRANAETNLGFSAGAGLFGDRREDFRIIGGIRWQPAPEGEKFIGTGDRDDDGVVDSIDLCPDEPEDRDKYSDDDGCPDADNDGDGIVDSNDQCPDEPEDKDAFQDDDGCPEADNDKDNVPDVTDLCPMKPEDMDKFEDADGCPEPDNDNDGILDVDDKCPNEPETVNGNEDTDGCPDVVVSNDPEFDPAQGLIDLKGRRIEFAPGTARLTEESKQTLNLVAGEMVAKKIAIRIEVHVARSTRKTSGIQLTRALAKDQKLAKDRADAVQGYLTGLRSGGRQMVPDTLFAAGADVLGSSRPRDDFRPWDENQNRVIIRTTETPAQ